MPGKPVSPTLAAQQRYLNAASERFLITSPSVSAILGANLLKAGAENSVGDSKCVGCGTTVIPGWSCRKVSSSKQGQRGARKHKQEAKIDSSTTSTPSQYYKCDRCSTKMPFNESPGSQRSRAPQAGVVSLHHARSPQAVKPAPSGVTATDTKRHKSPISDTTMVRAAEDMTGANFTSKKRARARKQSGLQALLAARNQPEPRTAGLDLMDFMKSV